MAEQRIADVLRNVTFSVDARGYAGRAESVRLPRLRVKTEDYRAGGMDVPVRIDMGIEPLEATIVSRAVDADLLRSWGILAGAQTQITVRGALVSESGATTAVVAHLRGQIVECDMGGGGGGGGGDWQAGDTASLSMMMAVRYYRLDHGGVTVIEIDAERMVRRIGAVDQLAEQRKALGLDAAPLA